MYENKAVVGENGAGHIEKISVGYVKPPVPNAIKYEVNDELKYEEAFRYEHTYGKDDSYFDKRDSDKARIDKYALEMNKELRRAQNQIMPTKVMHYFFENIGEITTVDKKSKDHIRGIFLALRDVRRESTDYLLEQQVRAGEVPYTLQDLTVARRVYATTCRSDLADGRVSGDTLKMTRVPELAKTIYKLRGKSLLGEDEADAFMRKIDEQHGISKEDRVMNSLGLEGRKPPADLEADLLK